MPFQSVKKVTPDALTLRWIFHVKNYDLTLDKNYCRGCQICSLACPKEAIVLQKQTANVGEKTRKPSVDIDVAKCNFCGICDVLCPYGAIRVTLNGKHALSVIEKESFPQLIRDIQINPTSCASDYAKCANACPINLIKVSWLTPEGRSAENLISIPEGQRQDAQAKVEVDKEHCACCRACELNGPAGAFKVKRFLHGSININTEKCPDGCTVCLDVCPITGALYLSADGKKVLANDVFCDYCGACKIVCPVDDALSLKRTSVSHTPVRSGAWNKALERIASPTEAAKELKSKRSKKAIESVGRRLAIEVQ